jgi:cyanobactin maturation PatA/PatG family protease
VQGSTAYADLERALPGGGDERITIAVLDGPVDLAHPCFAGARLEKLETLAAGSGGGRALAHGTHVASVIFGQPGSAVRGIAPACRGLIAPIFSDSGSGLTCSQLDLARAILSAVEHGAHIINISGGQLTPSGLPEPMLAQAVETCLRRNVLIVAAAGNDGCDCLHIPAAAPSVLAVGAMDHLGAPLASSNWGAAYLAQGVLAPGMAVLGAAPGGGTVSKSGTSFATPYVSGVCALLAAAQLARGEAPDPHGIRAAILRNAKPCPEKTGEECRKFLGGRIDIEATIRDLGGGHVMKTDMDIFAERDMVSQATAEAFRPSAIAPSASGAIAMSSDDVPEAAEEFAQPPAVTASGQIEPSDCGCGCGGKGKKNGGEEHKDCGCGCGGKGGEAKKPQLVYALGKLGYDFGTEARRDSLAQAMTGEANNPLLPNHLLSYLDASPYDASSVIWTLNLDATPIYAILPMGPFGADAYMRLREALRAQLNEGVELISVPGVISGSMRLQSGQVVPIIVPAIRGMYSWATQPLVTHVLGAVPKAAAERETYERFSAGLSNFLDRVYYDLRNLGVTGEERAINYSATNAVQIADVIRSTTRDQLDLDRLAVKKSPVCRPDSDCYDVELSFFNPNNTNVANRVYRFTVDVSDVIPVTVGAVRSWTRRA